MTAGEKTGDISNPFGMARPQVSAGLPVLESVLFDSRKRERPHGSSEPFEMLFL